MNMSFTEKSAWISLALTLVIWGNYTIDLIGMHVGTETSEANRQAALWLISSAVIMIIILEAVLHGILSMAHPDPAEQDGDERDKTITQKSANIAYTILFTGVVIAIGHFMMNEYAPNGWSSSVDIPFIGIHILLFSLLIAEIVRFSLMIIEYRRGV